MIITSALAPSAPRGSDNSSDTRIPVAYSSSSAARPSAPGRPGLRAAASSRASTSDSVRNFGNGFGNRGASSWLVGSSVRTPSCNRNRWNWRNADKRRAAVLADRPARMQRSHVPLTCRRIRLGHRMAPPGGKFGKTIQIVGVGRDRVAGRAALHRQHLQKRIDLRVHPGNPPP